MEWYIWMLIGAGSGIIVLPIGMWIFNLINDTLERRAIKRLINQGKFLTPIDKKDYDTKAWEKEIDTTNQQKQLDELNSKRFHGNRYNIANLDKYEDGEK